MPTTRREFLAHTPAAAFLAGSVGKKGPGQVKAAEPARASGWRSVEHNAAVGGVPNSKHTHGNTGNPGAIDAVGSAGAMNEAAAARSPCAPHSQRP